MCWNKNSLVPKVGRLYLLCWWWWLAGFVCVCVCVFVCVCAESNYTCPSSRVYLFPGAIWPSPLSTTLSDNEEKIITDNAPVLGKRKRSNSPNNCAQKETKVDWLTKHTHTHTHTHTHIAPLLITITKVSAKLCSRMCQIMLMAWQCGYCPAYTDICKNAR